MDGNFVEKIKELADKYSAAQDIAVELVEGAVKVSCDKGICECPDVPLAGPAPLY